jgi:hypothetical protein
MPTKRDRTGEVRCAVMFLRFYKETLQVLSNAMLRGLLARGGSLEAESEIWRLEIVFVISLTHYVASG